MKSHWRSSVVLAVLAFQLPSLRAETVQVIAGGGTFITGRATQCRLHRPFGIDFDRAGNIYIAEMAGGERVLKVDTRGKLTVWAGTGEKGDRGDGGPATQAQFNGMHSLAVGPGGDLFIADTWNNRVRRIEAKSGRVFSFAGTGRKGFSGDGGPASAAEFGNVYCVAFDRAKENLYLADLDNRRIRAVNLKTGKVRTVAGNGERGVPLDGSRASEAPLVDPRAVAVDSRDQVYILERSGHALRRVDRNGLIRTVAGTGQPGLHANRGDALQVSFNGPKHLCVDADDNVFIADTDKHVISKYFPREGLVIRVAGGEGVGGETIARTRLKLNQPHGINLDRSGAIYIADSLNDRVLKIEP